MSDSYQRVTVQTRQELREWLTANHRSSPGIWLVTYKKKSGKPHVTYDEVVEEALCFGWIDSKSRTVDEERSAITLTPRKPKSRWSRSNKERIERLSAAGLMTAEGIRVVEAAKKSGTWTALDDVEALIEPDDLTTALNAHPDARWQWDQFPPSARRAILEWITAAKRPETRAKRISETVAEAAAGRRANQWSKA